MNARKSTETLSAVGIIGLLLLMLVPLPTWMLSLLVVMNLAISVTVLLMTTYIVEALQFPVFPTLLLGLTLFRMALSIASTKLILLQGDAGSIIQAFGEVVVKGNAVVGFVIFLILIIVQFIVITKGSERVSEVAARFTLDAMPGKQMAVDAELNAGLIDEKQARARREAIETEADFYGAMDGASKFVRGDAIASIIIVIINIVGGITIGFMQRKMEWFDILRTYTILTIGDGLAHQIPALIVSTATGVLVTRTTSKSTLGNDLYQSFTLNPGALSVTASVLGVFGLLGLFTGLPAMPFFAIGGALYGAAGWLKRRATVAAAAPATPAAKDEKNLPAAPEDVMPLLAVEVLEIELGYGLLFLVDATVGGDLLERVAAIRRQCAKDLGIVIPPVRVRDNGVLPHNAYAIKLRGSEIARAELMPRQLLAMGMGDTGTPVSGIETTEPTFGLPALWISEAQRRDAELAGYTVVDNASVIATHLTDVLKSRAHELLGRQEVQALLNDLKTRGYTAIIDELLPQLLSVGAIQKVLQNLLRERVSIRNLLMVLECLADFAPHTKDTEVLTEYVRSFLGRQIVRPYAGSDGALPAVTFTAEFERGLIGLIQRSERGARLLLEPDLTKALSEALASRLQTTLLQGGAPVVLCSASLRPYLKRLIDPYIGNVVVLSYSEIPSDFQIRSLGVVSAPSGFPTSAGPKEATS